MKKRIAIVGGSSVDIFATSAKPLIDHDSNPGRVRIGFGGVGRNIAENLAYLKQDVLLIAPFGQDPFSQHMLSDTESAGVDIRHALIAPGAQAPYYISVNDPGGDMAVAIADLRICDFITPAFLSDKMTVINRCDAVIADTNIPEESIAYLVKNAEPPIFCDAVSTSKAMKLVPSLPYLFALKVNGKEAEALLGERVTANLPSATYAAARFHAMGIPHVFITMGMQGAFYSANGKGILYKAFQTKTVNTNGCGDAFAAVGFLGIMQRQEPQDILRRALAAAAFTAVYDKAVAPGLTHLEIDRILHRKRNGI